MKKILALIVAFVYISTLVPQICLPGISVVTTAFAENSGTYKSKKTESTDTEKEDDRNDNDESESDDTSKKTSKKSDDDDSEKSLKKTDNDSKKSSKKSDDDDSEKSSEESDDDDSEKSSEKSSKKSDSDKKSENKKSSSKSKSDSDDEKASEEEEEYVIHAQKYLVYDMNYNVNLLARDSNLRFDPSGLTKILTAITAIENIGNINKTVTVPDGILKDYDYYYANVGLSSGDKITYMNLLKLMMMRDAGDCAVALSHLCLDSYDDFINAMNETAKKAGATNSHFDNPAGFSSDENYSTLDDICLIIKYALGNEHFCEAASCSTLEIASTDPKGKPKSYFNRNYYMSTFYSLDYFNANIKHGKEYIVDKENTGLFVNYNSGLNNLICICAESDSDSKINYAYEDIDSLVNSAISDFTLVSLIQKDEIITEVPLKNGADSDRVLLVSDESIRTKLESAYDPLKIEKKVILNDKIKAPVKKGEQLGIVTVNYNGKTIGKAKLVAFSEVEGSITKLFMYYFDKTINSGWFKTVLALVIVMIVGYSYLKYRRKNS